MGLWCVVQTFDVVVFFNLKLYSCGSLSPL